MIQRKCCLLGFGLQALPGFSALGPLGLVGLALGLFGVFPTAATAAPVIKPQVIRSYPHSPEAFTQGLELFDGKFYESTGLNGRSSLRRVEPTTGEVELQVDLPGNEFGEGMTLVGDDIYQITWRQRVAHVYNRKDFSKKGDFQYAGEGWGLCFDGVSLVMSDGSNLLTLRNPADFRATAQLSVEDDAGAIRNLNELECVGQEVYANVWMTNTVLRIDAGTGQVLTKIDASGLLSPEEARGADVLNGIAYDPNTRHFFLTGKLWPKVFEVELPGLPPSTAAGGAVSSAAAAASNPPSTPGNTAGAPDPSAARVTVAQHGRGCACEVGSRPRPAGVGFPALFGVLAAGAWRTRRRANGSKRR